MSSSSATPPASTTTTSTTPSATASTATKPADAKPSYLTNPWDPLMPDDAFNATPTTACIRSAAIAILSSHSSNYQTINQSSHGSIGWESGY